MADFRADMRKGLKLSVTREEGVVYDVTPSE